MGAVGRRARRVRAGRDRWRRATSTGRISTRSCCSGSPARATPPTRSAGRCAIAGDYLPARVRLAEALFEAGELEESRRLFESLASATGRRTGRDARARPHRRDRGPARRGRRSTSSGRSRCFRSWGPRTMRSPSRIARWADRGRASGRSRSRPGSARAGRDRRSRPRRRDARPRGSTGDPPAGIGLAAAGDLAGAIAHTRPRSRGTRRWRRRTRT